MSKAHNRFDEGLAVLPSVPWTGDLWFDPLPLGKLKPGYPLPGALAASELCTLADKWNRDRIPTIATAQVKANGFRAIWIGGPHRMLVSREGEPLTFGAHAARTLERLEEVYQNYSGTVGEPMMVDGELAHPDGLAATQASYRRGVPDPAIQLWLFDAVPLRAWMELNVDRAPLDTRIALLNRALQSIHHPGVGMLRGIPVAHYSDIRELQRRVLRSGHEGLIIKNGKSTYQRARSPEWMKLKEELR